MTQNFHYKTSKSQVSKSPLFRSVVDKVYRVFLKWDCFILLGNEFKYQIEFADIYIALSANMQIDEHLDKITKIFYVFCSSIKIFLEIKKIFWNSVSQV